MVYARKKHGGASCYLVSPDMVQAFIQQVSEMARQAAIEKAASDVVELETIGE